MNVIVDLTFYLSCLLAHITLIFLYVKSFAFISMKNMFNKDGQSKLIAVVYLLLISILNGVYIATFLHFITSININTLILIIAVIQFLYLLRETIEQKEYRNKSIFLKKGLTLTVSVTAFSVVFLIIGMLINA